MIELRVADTPAELEAWAELKSTIVPTEPVTAAQLAATGEPGRLLLLAELDRELVGCGISMRSGFSGRAFIAARVLASRRGLGVGTALVCALCEHARALGLAGANGFVDAADPASLAYARKRGLDVVDYQLEQRRSVGLEPAPAASVRLVSLSAERERLLREAWPVAQEGYADLPLPGEVELTLETWLRTEATRPDGSFAAFDDGELVGYAGMIEHAHGPAVAEHGLTVVRRDRRRRGIALALKRAQLYWASANGVAELVTWTQKGNEAMQTLNRRLGYADRSRVLTVQGPLLPLNGSRRGVGSTEPR